MEKSGMTYNEEKKEEEQEEEWFGINKKIYRYPKERPDFIVKTYSIFYSEALMMCSFPLILTLFSINKISMKCMSLSPLFLRMPSREIFKSYALWGL